VQGRLNATLHQNPILHQIEARSILPRKTGASLCFKDTDLLTEMRGSVLYASLPIYHEM
jgi:hypothetical protein